MSASSVAIAASTSLCNKEFSHRFISLNSFTAHLPSKAWVRLKPLAFTNQNLNSIKSSLRPAQLPSLSCASESFEASEEEEEEEYPESEYEEEEREGRGGGDEARLYVGNLPYSISSSELAEIFSEAGRVVSVQIVYDRLTDRSRGFGFVAMRSVAEAQEAIRLFDGSQVGGRTVKVNFPEVPRGGEREVMGPKIRSGYRGFIDTPHKIYAGNLGWGVTSQSLRDAFASQPGLLSAKVIYERDTGRSRGFGFVSFESAETAQAAVSTMNGVEVDGRPLRLNVSADRAPRDPPGDAERSEEYGAGSSELLSGITC